MADIEQPDLPPLRPATAPPEEGVGHDFSGISASDNAKQGTGNVYSNDAGHSSNRPSRQHVGDVTYNNYYSIQNRRSDDALREESRDPAFLSACAEGQTPRVRYLLRLGVDLDYSDGDGLNALHHACLSGFEDVVELLLEAGVDINAQSLVLGTPLCLAVLREREKIVKLLLSSRANVNKAGKWIGSPLHCASWVGSLPITEMLLEYGANPALTCAVQYGYYNFSIEVGSPVAFFQAAKDSDGLYTVRECQPHHLAASRGHEALANHLLKILPPSPPPLSTAGSAIPTDSGYASMGQGDDVKTIVSNDDAVGMDEERKARLIFTLGEHLVESAGVRSEPYKGITGSLGSKLEMMVKIFATALTSSARPGIEEKTTKFIRQQRRRITGAILSRLPLSDDSSSAASERMSDPMELTLEEKFRMWSVDDGQPDMGEDSKVQEFVQDDDDHEDIHDIAPYLSAIRSFVTDSFEYRWLVSRIKNAIEMDCADDSVMFAFPDLIYADFNHRESTAASINVDWDLSKFVEQQLLDESEKFDLAKLTALTSSESGSSLTSNVYATTCEQYVNTMWPLHGSALLAVLQALIDNRFSQAVSAPASNNGRINCEINSRNGLKVTASGSPLLIIDVIQQMCWLSSACSAGNASGKVCSIRHNNLGDANQGAVVTGSTPLLSLDLITTDDLEPSANNQDTNVCWKDMFLELSIACKFPVPSRQHGEQGLEMPLDVMAQLGEADRATRFDGQLVLKGFCSMFVPMQRIGSSILWHFVRNKDRTRMSYQQAFEMPSSPASIDIGCLRESRHFVGWAAKAELRTGTMLVDYTKITYPRPSYPGVGCALTDVSISGGSFVTGGFTLTRVRRDTPMHIQRDGAYGEKVDWMSKIHVVLYDESDKRGWLVDGASALLHLLCTQLRTQPYSDSDFFKIADFQHASSEDGPGSARKTLRNKHNIALKYDEDDGKDWTVKDLILRLWYVLEEIYDYQLKITDPRAISLHATDREKLEGWAFMDLVLNQPLMRPRLNILEPSGRGWVDFTRSINAITLLGSGFGSLIVPKASSKACPAWLDVPKGLDYLAVCVCTLQPIWQSSGDCSSDPFMLSPAIYWHQAHALFEPCTCSAAKPAARKPTPSCDRVQVLLPKLTLGKKKRPEPSKELSGAVIFGKSLRWKWHWPQRGQPYRGDGPSNDVDSGIGTSIASASSAGHTSQSSQT